MKRIVLFFLMASFYLLAHAQWSKKDSINLRRLLDSDGEIKLNPNAVKQLRVNGLIGSPMIVDEKPGLKVDETLPAVYPHKKKIVMTLRPYSIYTKYNYDPISQTKIKVGAYTYKARPFAFLYSIIIPTNWRKHPFDGGFRKSLEEIEATGLRYNPLAGRANNMAVGAWESTSAPSGSDLMTPFTKEFWNIKGRKRRARTLEVLRQYGDSTTVLINQALHINNLH
ncbi:DUF4858 domain-containing protein [uncultured Bacteroides sp.]|uniref:DUF4858 domain-containing protein n=1 Tax=uncultured Bacteroides sp. TaxID=162156 RepID=UPI00374A9061